jgi:hypothetical protein
LNGFLEILPGKRGAQDRVLINYQPPRTLESFCVELPVQGADHLPAISRPVESAEIA